MSAQDRYTKIIESLVNGDEAGASDLLHEAFVEKAREIWSDLVEQDDIAEDEIAEEELEEAISDEEADDFLDDIETAEDEIESEEAFGEAEDEDEGELDMDAEMELAGDDEMDMDAGESDDVEDAFTSVEDALADLKATFAELMGDEEEADDAEDVDMDMDADEADDEEEFEEEFAFESDDEELEEEVEELDEAADLKKVGKDGKIHPVDMPAGDDGKASPVGPGNDMGGDVVKTGHSKEAGRPAPKAQAMSGFKHPGEGAALNKMAKGHGAEKKGAAPAKPSTDSLINKAPK